MLKEHNPTANPLAVFNMRRMDFCPIHFEQLTFDRKVDFRVILDWIYENTEGRFYIDEVTRSSTKVAFEVHSEATYFSIMLHSFNKFPEY